MSWHRIHPAFGIGEAVDGPFVRDLPEHEMPAEWRQLSDDDQDSQLESFFTRVLTCFVSCQFEVEFVDQRGLQVLLEATGAVASRGTTSGTLISGVAAAFAQSQLIMLDVSREGRQLLTYNDTWTGVALLCDLYDPASVAAQDAIQVMNEQS